ncbi:hypothetical protein ACIHAR_34045 [Streptomyces sp. NPDC052016]|uniref:hypothetical protein n=1 Tax=Streptomyces sp. NPDC052016 TaxID=3365680 RepID=UPI0037D83689
MRHTSQAVPRPRVRRSRRHAGRLGADRTALRIALREPLAHGERAAVASDVSITVPERNAGFGRGRALRFLFAGDFPGVRGFARAAGSVPQGRPEACA